MKTVSITIRKNFPLARLTTFRIGGPAKYYAEAKNEEQLMAALVFSKKEKVPFMILGGGSNMLVSDTGYKGLIIVLKMRGYKKVKETKHHVFMQIASGENWDAAAARMVSLKLWGAENLSYIPGTTGAAAVQNIGAYGQEIMHILESVEAYDTKTESIVVLSNKECKFRYRASIFNKEEKGRFIILSIVLRLKKDGKPNVTYPDVIKYFQEHPKKKTTLSGMRDAIISIRKRKLPDPKNIGNMGSVYKNIYLNHDEYEKLYKKVQKNLPPEQLSKLEDIKKKFYSDRGIKIPAAYLVDACGFRGAEFGGAKVHERQVLVLINATGHAKAHDVMMLMKQIRQKVHKMTGLKLTPEPELVGFSKTELKKYFELK
jgi:UDP-N-acetylmuramate dehydrogenase